MNYDSEQLSAFYKLCIMTQTKDLVICNIFHNLNFLVTKKVSVIVDFMHIVRDEESDAKRIVKVFDH